MPGLYNLTPFSLLDYPKEMACIVWMAGCNMRCAYCHNPEIVTAKGEKEEAEVFAFLEKRVGKLTAVVFSGGEATLYAGLPDMMRRVRAMGFKIKLDTNGSRPEVLRGLLAEGLLDYVAMDFKCPPEKAETLIGTAKLWPPFQESLKMLIEAAQPFSLPLAGREATAATRQEQGRGESDWVSPDQVLSRPREPSPSVSPPLLTSPARGEELNRSCQQKDFRTSENYPSITLELRTTVHPDLLDEVDLAWMIAYLDEAGYRGTYYVQNIAATGEKTIGNVAPPTRALDLTMLPKPKGFTLAFRNF